MENYILVIDNDTISNFLTKKQLEKIFPSFYTAVATDGKKALEFMTLKLSEAGSLPLIIFTEINLPDWDGFEVLNRFKKEFEEFSERCIFCILTNSRHPKDTDRAMQAGIKWYFYKPLSMEMLMKLPVCNHQSIIGK